MEHRAGAAAPFDGHDHIRGFSNWTELHNLPRRVRKKTEVAALMRNAECLNRWLPIHAAGLLVSAPQEGAEWNRPPASAKGMQTARRHGTIRRVCHPRQCDRLAARSRDRMT